MKNLLNSKWLIFINIIPTLILLAIYANEYTVIKSLLNDESKALWHQFAVALLVISVANGIYIIFSIIKKKQITTTYSIIVLLAYLILLYIFGYHSDDFIPRSIPRWMLSGNLTLYIGTFLMPTLIYTLFVIVMNVTSKNKSHEAWKNVLIAIVIPLAFYVLSQLILPLWRIGNSNLGTHALLILMVIGVVLFLFFLIRGVYILSIKKGEIFSKYQLIWKIPITIIFPIIGLLVNNHHSTGLIASNSGLFGDFTNIWFYILAALNGILICLPNTHHKIGRLLLFIGRSLTYTFTLYFFFVFLPFLPLSIIAIVAAGSGFLMLTPLVLFIVHTQTLSRDFSYLKTHMSKHTTLGISLLASCIVPLVIMVSFFNDRQVLHESLDYVYNPDYSEQYEIDTQSLQKTLLVLKSNKDRNTGFISDSQTPYLSALFKWIVLDNLTLSDSKIRKIETVFFGSEPFKLRGETLVNENVEISNINSTSTFNTNDNAWHSWIDLEITNSNTNNWISEYATTIDLPNGTWINDYYLYVGDRKEMGILAEKKSAMWVFSQIRNINRDPGLLYYLTGNKVAFRVFPFAKDEIRRTGIAFVHKEPVTIKIDGHEVALGHDDSQNIADIIPSESNLPVVYISAAEKRTLDTVQRKPYFHFIVDTSKDYDDYSETYIKTIEAFLKTQAISSDNAKISFCNAYTRTVNFNTDWKDQINAQVYSGGFYLERGLKTIVSNAHINTSNTYPVIVVVTENMLNAIIDKDLSDLKFAYPESPVFYHLNTLGTIASHSLNDHPKEQIEPMTAITLDHPVLAWPNSTKPEAFIPLNTLSDVILRDSDFNITDAQLTASSWDSGLLLRGKSMSHAIHPKLADQEWHATVRRSFLAKVMTPLTSYIVVENDAQKAALMRKQAEALAGKSVLDLNEDAQRMSEPSIWLLLLLFGLFFMLKQRKNKTVS